MRGGTDVSWREFVAALWPKCTVAEPCTREEIERAEATLGVAFPSELVGFYLESNGLLSPYGARLVLSLSDLIKENLTFWRTDYSEQYMPFTCLLFFGAEGNGDFFAYRILKFGVDNLQIYEWEHENDARSAFAPNLKDYLFQHYKNYDDDEVDAERDIEIERENWMKWPNKIARKPTRQAWSIQRGSKS